MENIRNSVPGYVPCVEAGDDKFREAHQIELSSFDVIVPIEEKVAGVSSQPAGAGSQPIYKDDAHWKPNDYIELSVVACLCNFVFGLAAMALSFRSQAKWTSSDARGAKCYGVLSMLVSVIAVVSTPAIIFVCIWFVMGRDIVELERELSE